MNLIRTLLAALLLGIGAWSPAHAEDLCTRSAKPLLVEYPNGGSLALSYQICVSGLSHPTLYWDSSVTYNNVSFDGSYRLDGTVEMRLNWSSDSIGSLVFRKGPLTFSVGGRQYAVVFNELTFNLDDRLEVLNTTGSLTINGMTVAADNAYLGYLLR